MGKKQTKEEVQKRLDDMGCEIDIIGVYKDTHTKCLCRCRKDGYEWLASVDRFFQGIGCPKCSGKIRLTNIYVDEKIKEKSFKRIGNVNGNSNPIAWKCDLDNHEWMASPGNVLNRGSGCPLCAGKEQLTNEIVDKRIEGRGIKRLDNVTGAMNKIRWQCIFDLHIWEACPNHITNNNSGCPRCSGNERLTNEIVDKRIDGRGIKRLDDINGTNKKINWQCLHDGLIWEAAPHSILDAKSGCPRCSGGERLTNEIIDKRIDGRYIMRLDDVNGSNNKVRWKCLKCTDYIWSATPSNVCLNLSGCPNCACSKRNDFIAKYLKNNGFTFIREARFNTCRYKRELPFDFFIPSKRVLIEADGPQHFEYIKHFHKRTPLNVQLEKDYIKTQWAKRNRYILIRLSHDQPEEEILASLANIRFYKDC